MNIWNACAGGCVGECGVVFTFSTSTSPPTATKTLAPFKSPSAAADSNSDSHYNSDTDLGSLQRTLRLHKCIATAAVWYALLATSFLAFHSSATHSICDFAAATPPLLLLLSRFVDRPVFLFLGGVDARLWVLPRVVFVLLLCAASWLAARLLRSVLGWKEASVVMWRSRLVAFYTETASHLFLKWYVMLGALWVRRYLVHFALIPLCWYLAGGECVVARLEAKIHPRAGKRSPLERISRTTKIFFALFGLLAIISHAVVFLSA